MMLKVFKSLNHKLINYVTQSALIMLLAATLVSYIIQYERSKINTIVVLNQLLDTVEDTTSVAVYSKNKQIAEEVIKGLMKNNVVNKVLIISEGGFSLGKAKNNDLDMMSQISRPIYSLFDAEEIIGHIYIQSSSQYHLREAKYDTFSSIISSFILIGLTAVVILWVMRKYISEPITLVSNTLNKIRNGEADRIAPLTNNMDDELGILSININNLLSELEVKFSNEYELRHNIELMEQRLRQMYDASSAGLFLLDLEGKVITSNSTLRNILKLTTDEGERDCLFSSFIKDQQKFEIFLNKAIESDQLETQDFLLKSNNSSAPVWVHCLISKIEVSNQQSNIEGVIFDVTRRVLTEVAIQHEAEHDSLTGLLRRQAVQMQVEQLSNNQHCCFLMLDLDGFKKINDTYGHLTGDEVLKTVSSRLTQCVRSSDLVCRLGGDEFLVILLSYHIHKRVFDIAKIIVEAIQKPMLVDDIIINVGISIGGAEFVMNQKNDFESMIKKADDAMYEVKRQGKNGYCFHTKKGKMIPKLFENKL